MILFRLFDRSIGIVSTVLLARLLTPNDFGLVAMAMTVIAFIELATAFGFEMALIQMREPRREHFDTAWTLNLCMAAGGALLIVAAAQPAAAFYNDPRLAPVMLGIGAAWMLTGLENIGPVWFRRELNFGAEFRFLAAKRVVAFAATLTAALTLGTYWALVIGMASGRLAGVLLSYLVHPYRPRPTLACTRELFSFSGWVFVNNALGVALGRVPHLVVGRLFGAQALGPYTVASEIAQLASTEIVAPINRAMFPGYARLTDDPAALRRTCQDATGAIALVALPVSLGIAVLAGPFVRLLLGPQWVAAVPVIQVLAIASTVSAITSNNASVYLALGRPSLVAAILLTRVVVLAVALFVFGVAGGILGVALSELAAAVGSLAVSLPILLRTLGLKPREYLARLWRPIAASLAMAWAIWEVVAPRVHVDQVGAAAAELLAGVAVGAIAYPTFIAALWLVRRDPDAIEAQLVRRAWAAWRQARGRGNHDTRPNP